MRTDSSKNQPMARSRAAPQPAFFFSEPITAHKDRMNYQLTSKKPGKKHHASILQLHAHTHPGDHNGPNLSPKETNPLHMQDYKNHDNYEIAQTEVTHLLRTRLPPGCDLRASPLVIAVKASNAAEAHETPRAAGFLQKELPFLPPHHAAAVSFLKLHYSTARQQQGEKGRLPGSSTAACFPPQCAEPPTFPTCRW